jgi:hypothetical protein
MEKDFQNWIGLKEKLDNISADKKYAPALAGGGTWLMPNILILYTNGIKLSSRQGGKPPIGIRNIQRSNGVILKP